MMRTILLFAYAVLGDAVFVFVGLPIQKYALRVALDQHHDTGLILALLAFNIVLLVFVLSAMFAALAGMRGAVVHVFRRK